MDCIVILFDEENVYENEKVFGGFSAVDLTRQWAENLVNNKTVKSVVTVKSSGIKDLSSLLETIKNACNDYKADFAVFSYSDLPFLNKELTEKLISAHANFKSEYTFADGYPYGFSPEILDKGTCGILLELSKTTQASLGAKKVTRTSLWDLIKTDVNSFEIESILANDDYRLLRYSFNTATKLNYMTCLKLYESLESPEKLSLLDVEELSRFASNKAQILKTVPSFYNLQICDQVNVDSIYSPYVKTYEEKFSKSAFDTDRKMSYEDFCKIVDHIACFSQNAVVSFSAFGEALNHQDILKFIEKVLSYNGLSVFIETDGLKVTQEFCDELKKLNDSAAERINGYDKIMIAVVLDSCSSQMYRKIHLSDCFDKAVQAVTLLQQAVPECVYPQFIRMNENESELETFYRYWSDKNSPSSGKVIIQQFDNFGGLLPDSRPADLAPIDRNVCWHLRRDVTIMSDGSVPLCHSFIYENIQGNVLNDGLSAPWEKSFQEIENHICQKYCKKCEECHVYYTFEF